MAGNHRSGRRKKANALKDLHGSRQPRNGNEPQYAVGEPARPSHLSASARAEWARIVPILLSARVLTPADGAALAEYCDLHALSVQIAKAMAAKDFTPVVDGKANPLITMKRQVAAQIRVFLAEFGLTPSSRTKVAAIQQPEAKDPFEAYDTDEGRASATAH